MPRWYHVFQDDVTAAGEFVEELDELDDRMGPVTPAEVTRLKLVIIAAWANPRMSSQALHSTIDPRRLCQLGRRTICGKGQIAGSNSEAVLR